MSITKQDVIKYATQTPQNTNPAVLNSLLDNFGNSEEVWSPEEVTGEGDVSIIYKGNQIGVLSDSGTLTLGVEGKGCEDDIEVEYTKSSGGSGVYYVNITDNDPTITTDKTPAEIGEAYENNYTVCCKVGNEIGYLTFIQKTNNEFFPCFTVVGVGTGNYFSATKYIYERGLGTPPAWNKYTYASE